jgi:hypothetical protein
VQQYSSQPWPGQGPHSLLQPSQTIGLGQQGRQKQFIGWPQGPQDCMQQQPLPDPSANTVRMQSERAIMAELPIQAGGGRGADNAPACAEL